MAFKKIEIANRRSLDVPAIHICKNISFFNRALCKEIGIEKIGEECRFDILHDEETNEFAVQFNDNGQYKKTVTKNHQIQVYLKGIFKGMGMTITGNTIRKLRYVEDMDAWACDIPEKYLAKKDEINVLKEDVRMKRKRRKKRAIIEKD